MVKNRIILNTVAVALGCLISETSYNIALNSLFKYFDNNRDKFTESDILNLLFINKDYKAIEYMDEQNITMLMLPITFIFIGLLLSCDFLSKPKGYYAMIACRTNNYKEMCRYIYGKPFLRILLYAVSYISILMMHCGNKKNCVDIIAMLGVYILFILLVSRIAFIIYKLTNGGTAIMASLITLMLVYLFDMYIKAFNIVLYDTDSHSVININMMIITLILLKAADKCISRKRKIYVY